jgi:hypothetical protein
MKNILVASLLLASSFVGAASLNDYSILLPLPAESEVFLLLKPGDVGALGPLIPLEAFDRLPQLVPETQNRQTYLSTLRVVGIRLDPCFVEGSPVQACRRQVRLVWQPVLKMGSSMTTRDAAVHTFYEFDDLSWRALLQTWSSLSSGKPADRLQVHPVIQAETLRGFFWQKLKGLLLKNCGANNLVRITAMSIRGNERIWTFAGFDIHQKDIRPILIARVNTESQLVALDIGRPKDFFGAVKPQPREDLEFFSFLRDSALAKNTLTEPTMKTLIAKAFDYENPKVHSTATLDCVSCHMAENAHRWGQRNFPAWNWAADFKGRYPNPWWNPSTEKAPFQPSLFRAFGYFQREPVISQRAFNETIEVAKAFIQ